MKAFPILALLLLLPGALPAAAAQLHTNRYALASGEILDREIWLSADEIDVQGTVEKDLFFMTHQATLAGHWNKDLWGAAQRLDFTGRVDEDLRLLVFAAMNEKGALNLNGEVAGDLHAYSTPHQNILHLNTNSVVQGDVHLNGHQVTVEGEVHGDLHITAANATVRARVHGDVRIDAEDITILPTTHIGGGLHTLSSREFVLDTKVQVEGGHRHEIVTRQSAQRALQWNSMFFIWALIAGLPLCYWFPRFTQHCIGHMRTRRFRCFWIGFGISFGVVLASTFLISSQVGFSLGLISLGFLGILLYLTKILFALALGSWLLRNTKPTSFTTLLALLVGLLLFFLLTSIPGLGGPIWFVIAFTGLGGMLTTLFESQFPRPKPPETVPEAEPGESLT